MPAFTIHDLYISMGGAASPQDYRNAENKKLKEGKNKEQDQPVV